MNILETLVKLRDDLKTWATNNLVALNSKIENLDYTDLNNQPNILDDNSDKFTVTDSEGNIILQVDENGLSTTSLIANGENVIDKINTHKDNELIHITQAEREAWEAKSNFDGDYNNLTNKPNLLDDNSDSFVIADSEGNVAMRVDSEGLTTTKVHAEAINLNGKEFTGDYNELENKPNIAEDTNGDLIIADENGNIVMKVDERGLSTTNISANSINFNGQEFSGDYNELENKPNLLDDNSDSFTVADKDGNVIAKIDGDGLKTTAVSVNGADVAGSLAANSEALGKHENNTTMHVTAAEKAKWNNKSTFSGDYNDLTNKPNLLDDGSDSFVVADKDGNIAFKVDENGATTTALTINGEEISEKVDTHVKDNTRHITAIERARWDDKSDFSGDYNDLVNKPIENDETGELHIADEEGNKILTVNKDGLTTTNIKTDDIILNGQKVSEVLEDLVENLGDGLEAHNVDEKAHPNLFANVVTVPGGGMFDISTVFGEGPYVIEFTEEEGYDAPGGGNSTPANVVTYEKQTLTEEQQAQVRENIGSASAEQVEELFTSVSNGKALVASAITDKGVTTANDATFETMANNIAAIESGGDIVIEGIPDDAILFTSATIELKGPYDEFNSYAYGNGKYVALSQISDKKVYISDDFINWEEVAQVQSNGVIAYGNGKFVILGYDDNDNYVITYSDNGVDWESTMPEFEGICPHYYNRLWFVNDKFFIAGTDGSIDAGDSSIGRLGLYYSYDGKNWEACNTPSLSDGGQCNIGDSACAYGNGKYLIYTRFANQHYQSSDGITWENLVPTTLLDDTYNLSYGNGFFTIQSYNDGVKYYKSIDGNTWEEFELPSAQNKQSWTGPIFFGDRFIIVRSGDVKNTKTFAYSYDLLNWEVSTISIHENGSYGPDMSFQYEYINTGNMFVISAYDASAVIVSFDCGKTWTQEVIRPKFINALGEDVTSTIAPQLYL